MKGKRLLHIPLIAMLILSMAMVGIRAGEYPGGAGTTIWVDDQDAHFQTADNLTSTRFNVSIRMQNVNDLYSWSFKMSYNTTLLDAEYIYKSTDTEGCTDWVPIDGGVWHPDGPPSIQDDIGLIWTGALFPSGSEFNGNGTLVIIRFHIIYAPERLYVKNWANCSLHLYDTAMYDHLSVWIDHTTIDGQYSYGREPIIPGAPVACFHWGTAYPLTDPSAVYVCDNVTLDASCSTPNGGAIVSYSWTITGPADPIGPLDEMITWFHCNATGIVSVNLTVTDSEGLSNWIKHDIEQLEMIGCITDVFTGPLRHQTNEWTPYVGKGLKENCDAFGPGDEIFLYAEVTYNGAPVNHVLVAFEILWEYEEQSMPCIPTQVYVPKNMCIDYRVAETNKSGIAEITVRVPLPTCEYPTSYYPFGKWLVIVTDKVQDVKQMDYLRFDVNYLVRIADMWTTHDGVRETTFYREGYWGEDHMDFHVVLKSIAWIPKPVVVVIVVYDECRVPLFQVIIPWTANPGRYCHPEYTIIDVGCYVVPQWAYVGKGKVYYSVFTALPHDCGVPFAPECSTDIVIKLGPRK